MSRPVDGDQVAELLRDVLDESATEATTAVAGHGNLDELERRWLQGYVQRELLVPRIETVIRLLRSAAPAPPLSGGGE